MTSTDLGPLRDRSDRHVRRSRLRLRDAGTRPRVEFALSEALRLVSLPGEEQGRVYYLRRVHVENVPADGNRAMWLENVQRALSELAARAMHGGDRRAVASDVVFFYNYDEALELLLRKIVNREPSAEWFWPLVSRCGGDVSRGEQIAAIVERLRDLPASWSRVAQILFSLDEASAIDVSAALPLASVGRWLRELGADGVEFAPGLALPENVARSLARAARRFGREDPRTIWLASLAVSLIFPSPLAGSVVAHARATLRRIEAAHTRDANVEDLPRKRRGTTSAIVFDEPSPSGVSEETLDEGTFDERPIGQRAFDAEPHGRSARLTSPQMQPELDGASYVEKGSRALTSDWESIIDGAEDDRVPTVSRVAQGALHGGLAPVSREYLGDQTWGAGLYFLLNALTRLGFPQASAADPRLAQVRLAARVLARLSDHAGVEPSDPILTWVNEEIERSSDAFASLQLEASAWPAIFGAAPRSDLDASHVVRAWGLAVRRWCWRAARLSVREIVNRSGRVLSNRTDVDVTFALDDADVRIRRVGLDLDPGWLPWFGCVVRFHYVREDPRAPAC